jgi:hypothetical protein
MKKFDLYGAAFFLTSAFAWFLVNSIKSIYYFPFILIAVVVACCFVVTTVWLLGFQWRALVVLAAASIFLDPVVLAFFIDAGKIKSYLIYFAHFLSIVDVGLVVTGILCLIKIQSKNPVKNALKYIFLIFSSIILISMVWLPHYRYV